MWYCGMEKGSWCVPWKIDIFPNRISNDYIKAPQAPDFNILQGHHLMVKLGYIHCCLGVQSLLWFERGWGKAFQFISRSGYWFISVLALSWNVYSEISRLSDFFKFGIVGYVISYIDSGNQTPRDLASRIRLFWRCTLSIPPLFLSRIRPWCSGEAFWIRLASQESTLYTDFGGLTNSSEFLCLHDLVFIL